jgi:hypothetical protein
MSALDPPWLVMKSGKRKKLPKLDILKRLEKAIMIKDRP